MAFWHKSEIDKVKAKYGDRKGHQFLTYFYTFSVKTLPLIQSNQEGVNEITKNVVNNILDKHGVDYLNEYSVFFKSNIKNSKLLTELAKSGSVYLDNSITIDNKVSFTSTTIQNQPVEKTDMPKIGINKTPSKLGGPFGKEENINRRNVIFQAERVSIITKRGVMTKGVPGEYYFAGDDINNSGTLPLLSPLSIDVENAVKFGIPGRKTWEGSKCIFVTENNEYRFYSYGCYPDGSGGCTIGQKKMNPKQTFFFGKSKIYNCIYHDYLVQADSSAYGTELYLFFKNIKNGSVKIYPWFGKYAIPTGRGSRYDQDKILDMKIDDVSDAIVIRVSREYYNNPSPDDTEYICNADTNYVLTVRADGDSFNAIADYPELNVRVVFAE